MFVLLSYMEQTNLYNQANTTNFAQFAQAQATPVPIFQCPMDPRSAGTGSGSTTGGTVSGGLTWYVGVTGAEGRMPSSTINPLNYGIFQQNGTGTRIEQITDGTSNTLMVGERPPAADLSWGWWAWSDMDVILATQDFIVADPIYGAYPGCPSPGIYKQGSFSNNCDFNHFWSGHTGGANWLLGDGSVRFIPYSAAAITIPMGSRAGGENVDTSGF